MQQQLYASKKRLFSPQHTQYFSLLGNNGLTVYGFVESSQHVCYSLIFVSIESGSTAISLYNMHSWSDETTQGHDSSRIGDSSGSLQGGSMCRSKFSSISWISGHRLICDAAPAGWNFSYLGHQWNQQGLMVSRLRNPFLDP